jgi:hypothetical protein
VPNGGWLTERRDASIFDLLRESAYFENRVGLEAHLRSNPALVDMWVGHSEDQRCTPAYYLRPPDHGARETDWVVGYLPLSGPPAPERGFPDGYSACAHFIQRFVESLSNLP